MTAATVSQPSAVQMYVKSAIHYRFGASAANRRSRRLGEAIARSPSSFGRPRRRGRARIPIEESQAIHADFTAFSAMTKNLRFATLVVEVIAAGLALFTVLRGVLAPLGAITQMMRRLADSDIAQSVPGLGRGDEIGSMAASVQVFKDNLIRTLEEETALARASAE